MKRFVPLFVVLFAIAAVLQIDFFFAVVYLFFGIYLLSRLWLARSVAQLRPERVFVNRAFPGDTVPVEVTVTNAGWLPIPWLEIRESLPVTLATRTDRHQVVTLRPKASRRIRYELRCRHRGYYRIGPTILRTGDLLGILPDGRAQLASQHLIVYPQVLSLYQLGVPANAPQPAIRCRIPLFEDASRVIGVRDYQRGDSPRHIHWTATASAGKLLVKQFAPSVSRETLVCLDLDADDYGRRQMYTATELAIVTAASVVNHIITIERLPVGLITRAIDPLVGEETEFALPPRSERAHLMDILEVLGRVQTTSQASFAELVRHRSATLPWGATIVIVTGALNQLLVDSTVYLRHCGFTPVVVLVQPGPASSELGGRAEVPGIRIYRVWETRDVERMT